MTTLRTPLSGWSRYPVHICDLIRPERHADLLPPAGGVIARGQGRSYGDAALNEHGLVVLTERVNRFLAFDEVSGMLRAEAGVTLAEVLEVCVPRGWFLPVTPGTKQVSLGGCVAADVHGKNHHHAGSFGAHLAGFELLLADGSRRHCSPKENAELFRATVGGMGLTGIIGEVEIQLMRIPSAQMRVEHRQAADLDATFRLLADPSFDDQYTVAWIDCLSAGKSMGRGVAMRGHHAAADELPPELQRSPLAHGPRRQKNIPLDFPAWVLNPATIRGFNALYHRIEGGKGSFLTDYERYFYPLDALGHWNRLYGKRGFIQYQCVIPDPHAYDGIRQLMEKLVTSRRASFLAVLKRFGPGGGGLLSFPLPGYTLALDLPLGPGLLPLLDELDQIVLRHGGRVYLAKDARLKPDTFRAMYPAYAEWLQIKNGCDPQNRFSSSLARRLKIGEAP